MGLTTLTTNAQESTVDSVMQHAKGKRFSIGGYGEVAMSRNFYSDHVSRYSDAVNPHTDVSTYHMPSSTWAMTSAKAGRLAQR